MFIIQKVTLHYDFHQDRICFTVQNANAQVMLVWMTQRFANNLVKVLADMLDSHTKSSATGKAVSATGQPVTDIHVWEQLAAQKQLKLDTPVKSEQAQRAILPDQIDVSYTQNDNAVYTLVFKQKQEGIASLQLNSVQLRQWLGIFYQMYEQAHWSTQVWPDWFSSNTNQIAAKPKYALH
jgi:hypothetical protein